MSKGDIEAGKAFVKLFLKDDMTASMRRSMALAGRDAAASAAKIQAVFAGIGAAAAAAGALVAGIGAATNAYAQFGGEISDVAARTGLSAENLQHLKFAAEQSGAGLDTVEQALRHMARNGMNVANFESLGKQIAAIPDPTARAAAAMETFGKSGTALLPMFQDFESLKSKSLALGPILTAEEVQRADELADAMEALGEALKRAIHQIGATFGPALKRTLDTSIGIVVKFRQLMSETNEFGRGGDWLDQAAEFLRTPFSDFGKIGAAAGADIGAARGAGAAHFTGDALSRRGEPLPVATGPDMGESIRKAFDDRNRLIREFETPAERFLRRLQEIDQAIKQVHANRIGGFVSAGESLAQQRGLETARQRLFAEELERRRRLLPNAPTASAKEAESERRLPRFETASAFSAAGALALGFGGGGGLGKQTLGEIKMLRKHAFEQLKLMREANARREKPGLFR